VAQKAAKKEKPRSRAEREADRRRVILRAAVEVFSRKGYHGCRIQDVAREAGVAYGLVYHYFKNKDELLESVFASGWQNFLGRVQAEIATDQHVSGRVKGIVHVAFEAYRRDPRGVKVLILEVGRSPAGGAVNRGGAFSSVILAASQMFIEAQRRGEIPPHLEPTLCATILFGSIEMGLTSFVMGLLDKRDDAAIERARDQVADTFLNGLTGARPQVSIAPVPSPSLRQRSRPTS
jgi:TetR/AcrR family transcriptional regulator, fatty acid metabolism regulator protein